jgi:hypothetical protein
MALLLGRVSAADPPANPPKDVPPKGAAPKDVAPKNAAPKEANPQPSNKDSKDAAPREPAKNPRDVTPAPRETNPALREKAQNPKDTAPRETTPAPRETSPTSRDREAIPAPGSTDRRNADQRSTARDVHRQAHRSDRDLGITFGRVTERGLAVSDLAKTSMLFKAGLRPGDFIISVNGHRLARPDDFDQFVYGMNNDERITVVVWRDGREEVVYLEPSIFYVDEVYDDDFAYFGVVFDDRYPDRLIVRRVYPDTPAFLAGLREGDVITTWHGERITNLADFGRILHRIEPGTVDFEYMRESKPMRADAKLGRREGVSSATRPEPPARAPR